MIVNVVYLLSITPGVGAHKYTVITAESGETVSFTIVHLRTLICVIAS
jgi:hypothetical protein